MRLISLLKMKEKLFHNILNVLKNSCIVVPYRGISKTILCQVAYEGLNYPTRIQFETMCQNDFMSKSTNEAWAFLEDFAENDQ